MTRGPLRAAPWAVALALVLLWGQPAWAAGDQDGDGDVDVDDVGLILDARNSPADPADSRDLDGDGAITVLDARIAVTQCTRPLCARGIPSIDIEKATNGHDADAEPGPTIAVGEAIAWTYGVINTGEVSLSDVTVTDDQGVSVACPKSSLTAGESMTCTASGTAEAGQYANVGTAEGTSPAGTTVVDDDPSHYFGE